MENRPTAPLCAPTQNPHSGNGAGTAATARRVLGWSGAGFLFAMPFTSSVAVRNVALGIALIAALALALRERGEWPLLPRSVLAAVAFWTIVCTASWLWSIDPAYTAAELRPELLIPLIAFGVFFVGSRHDAMHIWCTVLLVGTAVLGALALGEFALTGAWEPTRLHAGVGAYTTWLVMVFPLLLALAFPGPVLPFKPKAAPWPVLALLLLLVVGGAFLTRNRMVWLALVVVLVVFSAFYVRSPWLKPGDRRRLLVAFAALLVGLIAIFALAAAYVAYVTPETPTIQSTLQKDTRLELWRFALDRVAEAPIAGHGFGRGILRGTLQSTLNNRLLWHGHNVFLNVLLQTGVLGLAAFLVLLAAFASRFVAYVGARSAELNAIGIIGLAFLAGFLFKNLTDDFFVRHTGLLFWSMNGMLIGYGERLFLRMSPVGPAQR